MKDKREIVYFKCKIYSRLACKWMQINVHLWITCNYKKIKHFLNHMNLLLWTEKKSIFWIKVDE